MPTLTLTIVSYGAMTSYRVRDAAGRLVFATRAYSTPEGARERLRAWCRKTGNKLVLAAGRGNSIIPGKLYANELGAHIHLQVTTPKGIPQCVCSSEQNGRHGMMVLVRVFALEWAE